MLYNLDLDVGILFSEWYSVNKYSTSNYVVTKNYLLSQLIRKESIILDRHTTLEIAMIGVHFICYTEEIFYMILSFVFELKLLIIPSTFTIVC